MSKVISAFFELLRILVLLFLLMFVFGRIERSLYSLIYGEPIYNLIMALGNIIIFFVLYRNYFQFNGWYKSESNIKLSKHTTIILVIIAIGLIFSPAVYITTLK